MNCLSCLTCCPPNEYENIKRESNSIKNLPKIIECSVIKIINTNNIRISYHNELLKKYEYYNIKLNNVKIIQSKNDEAVKALMQFILNKDITINNIKISTQMYIHADIIFENINVNAWLIYNNLASYD
jgi:hypothetical protein